MAHEDPIAVAFMHPPHAGSAAAHGALDDAAGCARTVLDLFLAGDVLPESIESMPQGSERRKAIDDYEGELQHKLVANGIGAVLHLGRALVYAIEYVGDGLPYAGRGT